MVALFVDNLTVIDSAVLDAERGLIGQSWICDLVLAGALDAQSMVMDFGQVKKRIKQAIDTLADHKLLVPTQSPHLNSLNHNSDSVTINWLTRRGVNITHQSPAEAVCLLEMAEVTPERLAIWLAQQLMPLLPPAIEEVTIQLREEIIAGPFYHYVHGLKKHDGNCQRIAHGHRSKIEIWRDGALAMDLMSAVAADFADKYVVTETDVIKTERVDGMAYITTGYDAPQGKFQLTLPADGCVIISSDSTVECIAAEIIARLKRRDGNRHYRVKAFEGVAKGAIAES